MSFFGLEHNDLEKEKQKFHEGGLREDEDLAVYNWGQDDFGALSDALHEGGDELNDETFGGIGPIGKDFDFATHALPLRERSQKSESSYHQQQHDTQDYIPVAPSKPAQSSRPQSNTLDAIWGNKSPFSVLPRNVSSAGRGSDSTHQKTPAGSTSSKFSPFEDSFVSQRTPSLQHQTAQATTPNYATTGVHTLQEIEAEMRARSQQARALQAQAQHLKPPRMRSQSPSALRPQSSSQHASALAYQQHFLEQQERLRVEEVERQLREQSLLQEQRQQDLRHAYLQLGSQQLPNRMTHRQGTGSNSIDIQMQQQQMQQRPPSQTQLLHESADQQMQSALYHQLQQQMSMYGQNAQQSAQSLQNMQMQQRILAQLAQAELSQGMNGLSIAEQELLRVEAMKKIMEAERMEGKRRRKALKIAHMSRYNDLMTQSDKDFITRIQVSQLVTSDPYAEDFYAQVYGSLLRSRMGMGQDERVLKFGSGEGVGLGMNQRGAGRRPNAMQRMEAQVERIVSNARQREKEKGLHAVHSLQGALGKTAGRSYKAAPRQLLQVDGGGPTSPTLAHTHAHISKEDAKENAADAAKEAARRGREALGASADSNGVIRKDPLTRRESLIILESLYDTLLQVEQLRREPPPQDDEEKLHDWNTTYASLVQNLWDGLKVMVPLETSNPHPFISLVTPAKGKKLLPRLSRHLSAEQMLTVLTLLVACFSQLDVVIEAPLLDTLEESSKRKEIERQTHAFLNNVLQSILHIVAKSGLRLVSGLLGLLLERCDIASIATTRPGLALLTLFLTRVQMIKENINSADDASQMPSEEDMISWQNIYDHLFHILTPYFLPLFPSNRIAASNAVKSASQPTDMMDQPVWQFLAALALQADNEQQQVLVASLREKVLDNVVSASKGWVADEDERKAKIANVNLFLHALGLDSSQINL